MPLCGEVALPVVFTHEEFLSADLAPILGIGVVLGFRHAFEPDHVAAITTLAGRQSGLRAALKLGFRWSLGHTTTVALVALASITAGIRLPARLQPLADLGIACLLVLLGAGVILRWALGRWHLHSHSHDGAPHMHLHSHARGGSHHHTHARADSRGAWGVGLLHGLAGSGTVLALLVATVPTHSAQLTWLAAFGAGTILGMFLVSWTLWGVVRLASLRGTAWVALLRLASAAASVTVGGWLAARTLTLL
jgi:hypothetical protein